MLIVHVHVHVKPECVDAFKRATIDNASHSVQEPGIARFDVIQQADDPTRFVLVEVYRSQAATVQHKETAHYARWRDAVAGMLAEPRTSVKFANVFPDDTGWWGSAVRILTNGTSEIESASLRGVAQPG
jgi:autoinducer 2-degrading protein